MRRVIFPMFVLGIGPEVFGDVRPEIRLMWEPFGSLDAKVVVRPREYGLVRDGGGAPRDLLPP